MGVGYDSHFVLSSITTQAQFLMHLPHMEAAKQGMPVVSVNYDNNIDGPAAEYIHRAFVFQLEVVNSWMGLLGRNGTGKTTSLGYMAMHAIDGIPKNCQILPVDLEVVGDDAPALQCVLNANVERFQLQKGEACLTALQVDMEFETAEKKPTEELNEVAVSQKLEQIYKKAQVY